MFGGRDVPLQKKKEKIEDMKKGRCLLIVVLLFLLICGLTAQESDYESVFLAADRLFPQEAKLTLTMQSTKKGKARDKVGFTCYMSGTEKYLLIMEYPRILQGQLQLRAGDVIYFYNNKVNKMNKMSAAAAFMGTSIAQEDIMNTTLSRMYRACGGSEQTVDGIECRCVELEPTVSDAAYKKILVYIKKEDGTLLKREYFSYKGGLIKTMRVLDSRVSADGYEFLKVATEMIGNSGESTVLTFERFDRTAAVDPRLFEVQRLKYIR
jgi:hypothetical protein